MPPFGDNEYGIEDVLAYYGGWIMHSAEAKMFLTQKNIQEIDELIKAIINSNKLFQKGQVSECYKLMYDILYSSSYSCKIVRNQKVETENYFFRMRQSDNEYLYSKEELFHIPFQDRRKSSNQRFSLTGYPCLYLGKSIYVCWEELNRPKIENANIIGVKNIRSLNLLDLRMPTEITDVSFFYLIPLIIASLVKVQDPDLPFKPEYVISQAILHAIISHNNKFHSPNNYNGVIYYSSVLSNSQRLFDDPDLFENIVLPTVNNTTDPLAEEIYQNGFCPVLCNTFEITEPVSFNTHQLREEVISAIALVPPDVIEKRYSRTKMGLLEDFIRKFDTHKIMPNKFFRYRPELLKKY